MKINFKTIAIACALSCFGFQSSSYANKYLMSEHAIKKCVQDGFVVLGVNYGDRAIVDIKNGLMWADFLPNYYIYKDGDKFVFCDGVTNVGFELCKNGEIKIISDAREIDKKATTSIKQQMTNIDKNAPVCGMTFNDNNNTNKDHYRIVKILFEDAENIKKNFDNKKNSSKPDERLIKRFHSI